MDEERFRVPTRVVLTDLGASYFLSQNRSLQRFVLADEREEYGLELNDYSAYTLQTLIGRGFLHKLELPVGNVVGERQQIIDYVKLIVYSLLYRQFGHALKEQVLASDMVAKWNRQRPKYGITPDGRVPRFNFDHVIRKNEEIVQDFKRQLLDTAVRRLGDREFTDEKDRIRLHGTAARFLANVDPLVWFMLVYYRDDETSARCVSDAADCLARHIDRTVVADYLALMLVEVLQYLQTGSNPDPKIRPTPVFLLARTERQYRGGRTRIVLRLTIATEKNRMAAFREDVQVAAGKADRQALKDFYSAASTGEPSMGLYYLGFLSEACKRLNISFDSYVSIAGESEVVNMVLHLS